MTAADTPDRARQRSTSASDDPLDVSVVELVNVVLRKRWLVLSWTVLVPLLVVGWLLLAPRTYTSKASFYPNQSEGASRGLSGLASQFGVQIGDGTPAHSPAFYVQLFRSRELLEKVVLASYDTAGSPRKPAAGDSAGFTLVEVYGIKADDPQLRRQRAVQRLEEAMTVATAPETSIVSVSVSAHHPQLASQIGDRLLALVNRFNLNSRQSQAASERRFLEKRLQDARSDLRAVEDSLERFLENNRRFESSPRLRFTEDRLRRRVQHHQQLVTSLAQSYEEARLAAVRDIPVITIVDSPDIPPAPDSRGLLVKGALSLFVGAVFGVLLAFALEFSANVAERETTSMQEFRRLVRAMTDDLRRIAERIRQLSSQRET